MKKSIFFCIFILLSSSLSFSWAEDHVIYYGKDKLQFGELRLPSGKGPHPVIVLIHGGCWLAENNITDIRALATAFAEAGIATWALEYRLVGDVGGGWPGSFDDISLGADYLVTIAKQYNLDMNRTIAAGHSSGAHLAIWLSNRPNRWPSVLKPMAVLALEPVADLEHLYHEGVCGDVVDELMGGSPEQYPQRYQLASGTARLPLSIPQYIVIGEQDEDWMPAGLRYIEKAKGKGNSPIVIHAPESGHFEMIDPHSTTWPLVLEAAKRALGIAPYEETIPKELLNPPTMTKSDKDE